MPYPVSESECGLRTLPAVDPTPAIRCRPVSTYHPAHKLIEVYTGFYNYYVLS